MALVDTHCHIHSSNYSLAANEVIEDAKRSGVTRMLCVGTDLADSRVAVDFVKDRPECWATIGLHPHEATRYVDNPNLPQEFEALLRPQLSHLDAVQGAAEERTEAYTEYVEGVPQAATQHSAKSTSRVPGSARKQASAVRKIVAVGETGLDFYYNHSPKSDQIKVLRFQIELALEYDLPLIFHVREAFTDFWKVFDSYMSANQQLRGVVHSFSASRKELDQVLDRGLLVSLNGIMTFTKDKKQLAAAKAVPLQKLLLETDAPFLTPIPFRGKICQPKHVVVTAEFLANLRNESFENLASQTSRNAVELFILKESS